MPSPELSYQSASSGQSSEIRRAVVQIGEKLDDKADQGRCFICFVADGRSHKAEGPAQNAQASHGQSQKSVPQAMLRTLLKLLGGEQALEFWGVPHTERGMLGAVVFDTLGFHIPGVWSADTGWERRRNIGYISNLAVAPGARRWACRHVCELPWSHHVVPLPAPLQIVELSQR